MKGVFGGNDRRPSGVKLLLETTDCFLVIPNLQIHVVDLAVKGLQLRSGFLLMLDLHGLELGDLVAHDMEDVLGFTGLVKDRIHELVRV